jgi:FkbM family methyltransferase
LRSLRDTVKRGKHLVRCVLGRDVWLTRQVCRKSELLGVPPGSKCGGWVVCPEGIGPKSVVYSAGIGRDISFDLDLIRLYGLHIWAFDPTPESLEWLRNQDTPSTFHVVECGLAGHDGTAAFSPLSPRWECRSMIRGTRNQDELTVLPVRRLPSLMRELGHDHIDLLKLDIEGAEYEVIDDIVKSRVSVNQVLVEFHHRFPGIHPELTRVAARCLNDLGLKIFHVSPAGEEYSFLRVGGA